MASDDTGETRITTDSDQIEAWANEHDVVAVRGGDRIRMVKEEEFDPETQERVDWDELERELLESNWVAVHQAGSPRHPLDLRRRDEALRHVEGENVEERLMSGEVITGTITETAVVERTIVEEAEIQSEVVDRNVVDRQIVDVELLSRECTACSSRETTGDAFMDSYEAGYFFGETDDQIAAKEDLDFDLDVDETWAVTYDELEEYTIESRVTNVDVAGSETVEDVDLQSDIETADLHRHLAESNLFDIDLEELEAVDAEGHAIESEVHKGDAIHTTLAQERTVEREVAMAHRVTATGTESERTNVRTANEAVVSSGIADRDRISSTGTEAAAVTQETETGAAPAELTSDDEGKNVLDAAGKQVGVVSDVREGVAYVDPHPSITEKVMARLGWGDADEEDYAIGPDQIQRVDDDNLQLSETE